jgi:hypothetical protein
LNKAAAISKGQISPSPVGGLASTLAVSLSPEELEGGRYDQRSLPFDPLQLHGSEQAIGLDQLLGSSTAQ